MPLTSLGNIEPGDSIKVALIAGLAGVDTNNFTRDLDLGGVARNVITNNLITVVEGVAVKLAVDPNPTFRVKISLPETSPGFVKVQWKTLPGSSYQMQFSETLKNDWTDLPGPGFPRVASGITDSYLIPRDGMEHRYFRIIQLP